MVVKINIQRFNPKKDTAPYFQEYEVPEEFKEKTVSDTLEYIFRNLDPSLAFYRTCVRGVCGGCGGTVNGKSRMLCMTQTEDNMRIGPLKTFKVVRDLVTCRE